MLRLTLFSTTSLVVAFLISSQRKATAELRRSNCNLRIAMEDQQRIEAALLHSEMYLTEAEVERDRELWLECRQRGNHLVRRDLPNFWI